MSEEVLKKVTETTLEEPITITVDVNPQDWWDRLMQRWGYMPKKKAFIIKPIFFGTLIRISEILLSIDLKISGRSESQLLELNYQAIVNHSQKLADIVALAITNTDKKPDPALSRFILRNFTTEEMMGVLSMVLKKMDLSSFLNSIISVRGLNVLETPQVANATSAKSDGVSL